MSVNNQLELQPITILDRYDDIDGDHEERRPGFLTSANHAMCVDQGTGTILFVGVELTDEPTVYAATTLFTELGLVEDRLKENEIIARLSTVLQRMSAYDFIAKVIIHVKQDVDYAELIIPNLLQEAN